MMDTTKVAEDDVQKRQALATDVARTVYNYVDQGLCEPFAWHAVLVALSSFFSTCEDPKGAVDYAYGLMQEYVEVATPRARAIEAAMSTVN